MAVVTKAIVTQSSDGGTLTFTDETTGIGTLVSRILVITDSNNTVVNTVNLGATLTYNQAITKDVYYTFTETIIDNTGTYVAIVSFLSTAFYEVSYSPLADKLNYCGCQEKCINLFKGEITKDNAELLAERGLASLAQSNIDAANLFLTESDCGC